MIYEVEVRPGPNSDYFQYYTETVEALTQSDAVKRVQRRNPGCYVTCVKSWSSDNSGGGYSRSSSGAGGIVVIALFLGAIVLAIEALKIVQSWVMRVWGWISGIFTSIFNWIFSIWQWIAGIFTSIFNWIFGIWQWLTFSPLHFIGGTLSFVVVVFLLLVAIGSCIPDD